jgi:hypothetical protein
MTPTRAQVERLLAARYRPVLIKASAVYVWERGGRLYSAEAALQRLEAEGATTDTAIPVRHGEAGRG